MSRNNGRIGENGKMVDHRHSRRGSGRVAHKVGAVEEETEDDGLVALELDGMVLVEERPGHGV